MSALAAYEAGLTTGASCWLRTGDGRVRAVPVRRWTAEPALRDAALVEACLPARAAGRPPRVLDVGCGPGRLTRALRRRGAVALGVDVSAAAVELARRRGAAVVQGDVFAAVPGEGSWDAVLLADGNIGIGGDPARLLRRAADLLAPGGRIVADVEPTGGVYRSLAWLEAEVGGVPTGGPLRWAWVGADGVAGLAAQVGMAGRVGLRGGRWLAVWSHPPGPVSEAW